MNSQKGEITTLFLIASLVLAGLSTVVSSVVLQSKLTTSTKAVMTNEDSDDSGDLPKPYSSLMPIITTAPEPACVGLGEYKDWGFCCDGLVENSMSKTCEKPVVMVTVEQNLPCGHLDESTNDGIHTGCCPPLVFDSLSGTCVRASRETKCVSENFYTDGEIKCCQGLDEDQYRRCTKPEQTESGVGSPQENLDNRWCSCSPNQLENGVIYLWEGNDCKRQGHSSWTSCPQPPNLENNIEPKENIPQQEIQPETQSYKTKNDPVVCEKLKEVFGVSDCAAIDGSNGNKYIIYSRT